MTTGFNQESICKWIVDKVTEVKGKPEDIRLNHTSSYSALYFFGIPTMRIKIGKKKSYIALKDSFSKLLLEYPVLSTTERAQSEQDWIRILLNSVDDINGLVSLFLNVYDEAYQQITAERFSCCSRYIECSDNLACVQPNRNLAKGCTYREKLIKGIVFYGKNRNLT